MTTTSTHVSDLAKEVQPPAKGILSRTLFSDDRLKAVALDFAPGEELSEHTASMPAVLHFLQGEAKLTPGGGLDGPGPLTAPGFGGRPQPAAWA
jgi:quercetin dioxygenase-like cupin family protein